MPLIQINSKYVNLYYKRLLWLCTFIQAVYAIISIWINAPVLAVLNGCSILLYIILQNFVNHNKRRIVLSFIYIQNILFTVCSVLYLGWNCGFQNILFCVATFVYFFPYHNKYVSYIFISADILIFILLRVITEYFKVPYAMRISTELQNVLYLLNACVAFGGILVVAYLCNISSILTRKDLEEENRNLCELASHDPLTGLLNRRSMQCKLEKIMDSQKERIEPFCIILCDIDDFKSVNDCYGHKCGDIVLQHAAKMLSASLRNSDNVCRWGGEEFLVLLEDTPVASALKTIERLRENIAEATVNYCGEKVHITMTFGICEAGEDVTPEEIVRHADMLMYEGKRRGKNCVVHTFIS